MNRRKEKVQEGVILLILAIVIGVVIYVTQKLFSKDLPPNILTILLLCAVALLIFNLIIYFIWGKDKKLNKEISIYPPSGMDGFVAGYLDTGEVQSNHFVSLILSLAIKKYITLFKDINGKIIIKKIKEIDKYATKFERYIYKILFKGNRNIVSSDDLYEKEGHYFSRMESIINNMYSKDKNIEDKTSRIFRKITGFLFAILLISSFIIYSYFAFRAFRFRVAFTILLLILAGFMYALLSYLIVSYQTSNSTYIKYAILVTSIFILCGNISVPYFSIHYSNVGIMFVCQLNLLLLCVIVNGFIFKRSEHFNYVISQLSGFKNKLQQYNTDNLLELYKIDNEYFYEILPYLFSLELSIILFDENEDKIKMPFFYSVFDDRKEITLNDFSNDMDIIDDAILNSY